MTDRGFGDRPFGDRFGDATPVPVETVLNVDSSSSLLYETAGFRPGVFAGSSTSNTGLVGKKFVSHSFSGTVTSDLSLPGGLLLDTSGSVSSTIDISSDIVLAKSGVADFVSDIGFSFPADLEKFFSFSGESESALDSQYLAKSYFTSDLSSSGSLVFDGSNLPSGVSSFTNTTNTDISTKKNSHASATFDGQTLYVVEPTVELNRFSFKTTLSSELTYTTYHEIEYEYEEQQEGEVIRN